jgi:hypothetical protein
MRIAILTLMLVLMFPLNKDFAQRTIAPEGSWSWAPKDDDPMADGRWSMPAGLLPEEFAKDSPVTNLDGTPYYKTHEAYIAALIVQQKEIYRRWPEQKAISVRNLENIVIHVRKHWNEYGEAEKRAWVRKLRMMEYIER